MSYSKYLSIVFNKEVDVCTGTDVTDVYLKINVNSLKSGLLKKVQKSDLTVFLAIASYMDIENKCYPTQRQLAEVTGMSVTTINKSINNLLTIEIDGRPLLSRHLLGTGSKKSSLYTIFDVLPEKDTDADDTLEVLGIDADAPVDAPDGPIKKIKVKNARDYALYYADKYKEVYGESYIINYKRDLALIKSKLIPNFKEDQIIEILDICIEQYKEKWSSYKYQYPTISMICSWLGNEAVKEMLKKKDDTAETEQLIQMASADTNSIDFNSI